MFEFKLVPNKPILRKFSCLFCGELFLALVDYLDYYKSPVGQHRRLCCSDSELFSPGVLTHTSKLGYCLLPSCSWKASPTACGEAVDLSKNRQGSSDPLQNEL